MKSEERGDRGGGGVERRERRREEDMTAQASRYEEKLQILALRYNTMDSRGNSDSKVFEDVFMTPGKIGKSDCCPRTGREPYLSAHF